MANRNEEVNKIKNEDSQVPSTSVEKVLIKKQAKRKLLWKEIGTLIKKKKLSFVCFIFLSILILIAIFAPIIIPYPDDINGGSQLEKKFQPPNMEHLFGTDERGRDLFSRVIYGTRIAFQVGLISLSLSAALGFFFGAGVLYFGNRVSETIKRICEIFQKFPALSFLFSIGIATLVGASMKSAIIAISVSWWPWYTIPILKQIDSLKERGLVEATHSLDGSAWIIIFKRIVSSNNMALFLSRVLIDMGTIILMVAALGFMGLGAQPPELEWGLLMNIGREFLFTCWWYVTFPGIFTIMTVLAFGITGKGLKEYAILKTR